MARLPQIGAVDYSGRPGATDSGAVLPVSGEPLLRQGADALADLGNVLARDEAAHAKALQDAQDAKNKIVDTVTATRGAGDFEENLRQMAAQLQEQFFDNPQKAAPEFLKQARQRADDFMKAAPNGEVMQSLAQKTASIVDSSMDQMHSWEQLRATQKAKGDMAVMVNQATFGAGSQPSPDALAAYAKAKHGLLDPIFEHLTDNKKMAASQLDRDMARSWVVTHGLDFPVETMAALDGKHPFLVANLTDEDRKSLRAATQSSYEGLGKRKEMKVLEEAHGEVADAYEAFRSGDLKFSAAMDSARNSINKKKELISLDPNMPEASRKAQLEHLDVQSEAMRYLDLAARKQAGWDPKVDEDLRTKFNERHNELFPAGDRSNYTKDLASILAFRRDASKAVMENLISRSTFDSWNKHIALSMEPARASEQHDTGWSISFMGFGGRSPRQAGSLALKSYFDKDDGRFANLKPEQKNSAYELFVQKYNDALEAGRNVDAAAAQDMATDAVYLAAGKPRPRGGR